MNAIVIPICPSESASAPEGGCGHCLTSAAGPVCRSDLGPRCTAPVLVGPPERVQEVLAALDRDLGVGAVGADGALGLVHALTLRDGEAELTLAVARRCGGALLADTAFQTLRRLLPDTDIYVTHLAA